MSLIKEGYSVYPLSQRRIQLGRDIIYDRDTRGEDWFILDLALPGGRFVPKNSGGLITARGLIFKCQSRHGGLEGTGVA